MSIWQNDNLAKWQVDKMQVDKKGKLAKWWLVYNMTSRQKVKCLKWQVDDMANR